jgi:nitrous oxidase accessory protein NosD
MALKRVSIVRSLLQKTQRGLDIQNPPGQQLELAQYGRCIISRNVLKYMTCDDDVELRTGGQGAYIRVDIFVVEPQTARLIKRGLISVYPGRSKAVPAAQWA